MIATEITRSVKVKFSTNGVTGLHSLAHPLAKPGTVRKASVQIAEITDVPAEVSDLDVVRLWSVTCDCTWLAKGEGRHVFKFSELGAGRLIFA